MKDLPQKQNLMLNIELVVLLLYFRSGNQLEMTLKLERYFIPSNLIFYLKSHMDKEDLM